MEEILINLLTNAIDTTGTLNQADDRPGQVVIDNDVSILEVLSFGENIRRNQNSKLTFSIDQLLKLGIAERRRVQRVRHR